MSDSNAASLDIVVLGLSLRSSWGNGHATTYRALIRALVDRGHRVSFLERDVAWYDAHCDATDSLPGTLHLYRGVDQLEDEHGARIAAADLVIVGSYVPDGIAVIDRVRRRARGVLAFYDIDTPVTLGQLARGECDFLAPRQIPAFDLYLSFTGGPALRTLERDHGARRAIALHCAYDPERYFPVDVEPTLDLGYMGTYSEDRQPTLDRLLVDVARRWREGRFAVAGPQYPEHLRWPPNVSRIEHVAPSEHRAFYGMQRFTLNVTRADMIALGWSPSVRLFEAAACATPIISDDWPGLSSLFAPGREILIARDGADVLDWLRHLPEERRHAIGEAAHRRVRAEHTAAHRAQTLETAVAGVARARARRAHSPTTSLEALT